MERIKNILQRLQELYYSKHQKSAIDVDLMLDYTRVMYADLLEWRKEFKEEPPTTESAEPNREVVTREEDKQTPVAADPAVAEAADKEPAPEAEAVAPEPEEKPAKEEDAQPSEKAQPEPPAEEQEQPEAEDTAESEAPAAEDAASGPEAAPEDAKEEAKEPQSQDKVYKPIQHDDPAPKEPLTNTESEAVVKTEPEKEHIDTLQKDASGISFEPPSATEVKSEVKEELLIEPASVNTVIEEIPAPAPAEIPLPDMSPVQEQKPVAPANLFSTVKLPKDIRSAIGINDKYLFLNELFNNHKSNYEEALDQLNHFSTAQQAEDWIRTRVAPANKWDDEDATVTSFYAILKRHFSDR